MAVQAYRDYVERVREATDIVRVVSDYVPLRKRGRRHTGLCPFHTEKTSSFGVDEEKQLFYCFGCQTGGDVFKFVMLYERLEFPEAVRLLGDRAGIAPPVSRGAGDPERRSAAEAARETLCAIHREAAAFYRKGLVRSEAGAPAREFLAGRGLNSESAEALGLGWAPEGWDALKAHLTGKGFQAKDLLRSGLFSQREDGSGFYDRFRGRVMFPILDLRGEVVAFGGRVVGDGEPKYLNSPETPLYTKGDVLYGLSWSRDAIRRAGHAIVVEGYMDLASLRAAGIEEVVATLGTAFTASQARLLSRYAKRVTVSYDPDSAGVAAARRSLDLLLERGFEVKVVMLPRGLDPDAFVRERGAEAYRRAVEEAPGYLEFVVTQAVAGRDLKAPGAAAAALDEILPHVARLESPAERSLWYGRIAETTGIEDEVVLQELRRALAAGKTGLSSRAAPVRPAGSAPREGLAPVEVRLVRSLMDSAEAREGVLADLTADEIEEFGAAALVRAIREAHLAGEEPTTTSLMDRLPEGEPRELLTRIVFLQEPAGGPDEAMLCVQELRKRRMIAERKRLQKEIDAAGASVPADLLRRKMELARKINALS